MISTHPSQLETWPDIRNNSSPHRASQNFQQRILSKPNQQEQVKNQDSKARNVKRLIGGAEGRGRSETPSATAKKPSWLNLSLRESYFETGRSNWACAEGGWCPMLLLRVDTRHATVSTEVWFNYPLIPTHLSQLTENLSGRSKQEWCQSKNQSRTAERINLSKPN